MNTGRDINGDELTGAAKEVNERFRCDVFDARESFEASMDEASREKYISMNSATTCGLNENLDGRLDGAKFESVDKAPLHELYNTVPEITSDTVMQKVVSKQVAEHYLNGDFKEVGGCVARAQDVAPFVNNGADAYRELRLDYPGNDALRGLEKNSDMYVVRFTSEKPFDTHYPDYSTNYHPCTSTGFTASPDHLIPEYDYRERARPSDGAIFKIDAKGNETLVGMWNNKLTRFVRVP